MSFTKFQQENFVQRRFCGWLPSLPKLQAENSSRMSDLCLRSPPGWPGTEKSTQNCAANQPQFRIYHCWSKKIVDAGNQTLLQFPWKYPGLHNFRGSFHPYAHLLEHYLFHHVVQRWPRFWCYQGAFWISNSFVFEKNKKGLDLPKC